MERRARGGVARKDGGSHNIFDSFLDDAAHWTGAHFGIIAFID